MIPERAIIEWREFVPWIREIMVEQDLIICRALIAIYNLGNSGVIISFLECHRK